MTDKANASSAGNSNLARNQRDEQAGESRDKNNLQDPLKQAAKKERQPTNPGDLYPVHNTHEVGTSGGDQRAPDKETPKPGEGDSEQPGKPVRPIPVEEPGEGSAPKKEYEEPAQAPPASTDR